MPYQHTFEDLNEQFAMQARTFEERLSVIEASRDTGGLREASARGDQPPTGFVEVGTSEQVGFAASRRVGGNTDSLRQTVRDELEITGVAVSLWDLAR